MGCKFERISAYANDTTPMPIRKTAKSAAYDMCAIEDIKIPSYFGSVIKMLAQKITDSEVIEKIQTAVTEDMELMFAIANQDTEALQGALVKYAPMFEGFLSVDLAEMKQIVKNSNSKITLVPTGLKAKMDDDQVLELFVRSSCPLNYYLLMANSTGIIDADYYNNPDNEGHIYFQIINLSPFEITIKKGEVIGQGMFTRYCVTDDDEATGDRLGGFGSTSA
jgi:dUTP pyrophosphatase